jgi:hypothetical protein
MRCTTIPIGIGEEIRGSEGMTLVPFGKQHHANTQNHQM